MMITDEFYHYHGEDSTVGKVDNFLSAGARHQNVYDDTSDFMGESDVDYNTPPHQYSEANVIGQEYNVPALFAATYDEPNESSSDPISILNAAVSGFGLCRRGICSFILLFSSDRHVSYLEVPTVKFRYCCKKT